VRFGIFFEHQLPRPWGPDDEHDLLQDALEQVEVAERSGVEYAWQVEHHFLEEYAHGSASDVFLAAASQRARKIRLGFGILPLPIAYQHPARVAETVATLDLMSSGRVELGTGETGSGIELAGFGVERATKRAQWEEAIDALTRMFVEEPFAGADGRYLRMPPRNVIPKPRQRPHPPLWVACSRRDTIRMAAQRGIGALSFSFVEPEEAGTWVREYEEIIASERCVPAGFAVNPRVAVTVPMHVHRDEATAIERGIDGAHFFGYALAHYYVFGEHRPGRTDLWAEFQARRDDVGFARGAIEAAGDALGIKVLEQGLGSLRGAIGTPEQVRDLLRRYERAGVDQVLFVMQAGRTRHEHICEALELFGAEVAPEFAARADAADAARAERLGPAIEAALARRAPARVLADVAPVAPLASGPPARRSPAETLRSAMRRIPDRSLERTVGSDVALRLLFTGMAWRFQPERSGGFQGELEYVLGRSGGDAAVWTVVVQDGRARAERRPARKPALTVRLALTDMIRVAAGELDLGVALFDGRLRLEGDLALATRLGPMFGAPSPL
jgi:alkanesulfonate monooxygenase SsuD/methylene tetrahydromethanopterin reductase-like flavin-dependent oxidoreductase (luciferase family)/putative sterol carrier protein